MSTFKDATAGMADSPIAQSVYFLINKIKLILIKIWFPQLNIFTP